MTTQAMSATGRTVPHRRGAAHRAPTNLATLIAVTLFLAVSHLRRALALFDIWRRRFGDREALALMDERSLRDLGLTRYDALYEARKPFWRE